MVVVKPRGELMCVPDRRKSASVPVHTREYITVAIIPCQVDVERRNRDVLRMFAEYLKVTGVFSK